MKFDRFMVAIGAANNLKTKRLKRGGKEVRWAWFHGVLPIAAQANPRGCFLVGELPADEHDVAAQADVTAREARKALEIGRLLGMLYHDDDLNCERVHDFEAMNPAPKVDRTNAERQARYRGRRNAVTNGDVTPPEVEVEVEVKNPPSPPDGGPRIKFDKKVVPAGQRDLALAILGEFNRQAGTRYQPLTGKGEASGQLKRILGTLADHPDVTFDVAARMIRQTLAAPYWGQGKPHTGMVFGANVREQHVENATAPSAALSYLALIDRDAAA